jgi:hypothetical protein
MSGKYWLQLLPGVWATAIRVSELITVILRTGPSRSGLAGTIHTDAHSANSAY